MAGECQRLGAGPLYQGCLTASRPKEVTHDRYGQENSRRCNGRIGRPVHDPGRVRDPVRRCLSGVRRVPGLQLPYGGGNTRLGRRSLAPEARVRRRRCGSRPPSGCTSRLLRTLRLAIWFFTLWFRRRRSRTVNPSRIPNTVIWFFVSALIPMVLGANGVLRWKSGRP